MLEQPDETMLRITPRLADDECLLKLEGSFDGRLGAGTRERAGAEWRRQRRIGAVRVDLTDVSHVDAAGRALMTLMYRAGVRFIATGFVMPDLLREIASAAERGRRN